MNGLCSDSEHLPQSLTQVDNDRKDSDKNCPNTHERDLNIFYEDMEFSETKSYENNDEQCRNGLITEEAIKSNRFLTSDNNFGPSRRKDLQSPMTDILPSVPLDFSSKRTSACSSRRSSTSGLSFAGRGRSNSSASQSEFLQNLCKKYPQAFQKRLTNASRPSRAVFSPGLRVHFEDNSSVDLETDRESLCSNVPINTKWDKEIEKMLGEGQSIGLNSVASPRLSVSSETLLQDRFDATSETLKRLLQHRKYHRSKLASDLEHRMKRWSISSCITEKCSLEVLENELEQRERILQGMDHNQNYRKCQLQPSKRRVQSPESPSDSAIDTSSIRSSNSNDQPMLFTDLTKPNMMSENNVENDNSNRKTTDQLGKRQTNILVRKRITHRDSDVDSGIVPISVNEEVIFDPPSYSTTIASRSESDIMRAACSKLLMGQRPKPMKADHSISLNLSSPTDENDSIAQEIIAAQMMTDMHTNRQTNSRGVHFEDEVDDTDPRLGIPTITLEEQKIAENYKRHRANVQFEVKRSCLTARDERPKTMTQARSHDHISVLCSPRKDMEIFYNNEGGHMQKAVSQEVLFSQPVFQRQRLKPQKDHATLYSSQPNLSSQLRLMDYHKPLKINIEEEYEDDRNMKSSLRPTTRPSEMENGDQILLNGATNFDRSKVLSKSQPNLVPQVESLIKGGQPLSRTSSSNSEHSSNTISASHSRFNDISSVNRIEETNQNILFGAKPTKKTLHLRKYFKAKKGRYNPSVEENFFELGLAHGSSMPNLSAEMPNSNVQYSQISKHRSMQNMNFNSKDLENESGEDTPETRDQFLFSKPNLQKCAIDSEKGCDRVQNLGHDRPDSKPGAILKGKVDPSTTQINRPVNAQIHRSKDNQNDESDTENVFARPIEIDSVKFHSNHVSSARKDQIHAASVPHERRYRKRGESPVSMTRKFDSDSSNDSYIKSALVDHNHQYVFQRTNPDVKDALARVSVSSSVSSMSSLEQNDKTRGCTNEESSAGPSNRTYTIQKESTPLAELHKKAQNFNKEKIPQHVYADVKLTENINDEKGRPLHNTLSESTPNIAKHPTDRHGKIVTESQSEGPANRESNLIKSQEMSASRQSLSDKVGSFKKSAKNKFKALRKAVSMDKGIDDIGSEGQPKEKKKKKRFFGLFKKKSKQTSKDTCTDDGHHVQLDNNGNSDLHSKWTSCHSIDSVSEVDDKVTRLVKINSDGTQVVQIQKQQNKAIDFFISRGNSQFKHGIFVSRFIGNRTDKYSGLLSVGDEILEVNGFKVKDMLIDDVYGLLSNAQSLVITILPLLARKDV